MSALRDDGDTICALATPPGVGGLSIVRTSGPRAYEVARLLCPTLPKSLQSHHAFLATVRDPNSEEALDHAVVTAFEFGKSYTGEETCEFSCHGSPAVISTVLRALVSCGCRVAKPGEFTYRAYMNGRLDLAQAEAVLALIESRTADVARASLRQVQGSLSREFAAIEDGVTWLLAHLEASIDFSSEGIEVVPSRDLIDRMSRLVEKVCALSATYERGRTMKDGLSVVLIGAPNVGKSSLLNAFLGEDRAIVTDEVGTTRDLVEGEIMLGSSIIRLIDTAGVRQSTVLAEKIGIEKSRQAGRLADVVLLVVDGSQVFDHATATLVREIKESSARFAMLINKIDRPSEWFSQPLPFTEPVFKVSALTGEGLSSVLEYLGGVARSSSIDSGAVILVARQHETLQRIENSLRAAVRLVEKDASPEFIAFEMQEALQGAHALVGKQVGEQVIDRVFKEFCLGK